MRRLFQHPLNVSIDRSVSGIGTESELSRFHQFPKSFAPIWHNMKSASVGMSFVYELIVLGFVIYPTEFVVLSQSLSPGLPLLTKIMLFLLAMKYEYDSFLVGEQVNESPMTASFFPHNGLYNMFATAFVTSLCVTTNPI